MLRALAVAKETGRTPVIEPGALGGVASPGFTLRAYYERTAARCVRPLSWSKDDLHDDV